MKNDWSFEPLQCGLYLNTVFGHDFWTKQPTKYDSGYYPFSTRLRPNVLVGERFTKVVPNNRRKFSWLFGQSLPCQHRHGAM